MLTLLEPSKESIEYFFSSCLRFISNLLGYDRPERLYMDNLVRLDISDFIHFCGVYLCYRMYRLS